MTRVRSLYIIALALALAACSDTLKPKTLPALKGKNGVCDPSDPTLVYYPDGSYGYCSAIAGPSGGDPGSGGNGNGGSGGSTSSSYTKQSTTIYYYPGGGAWCNLSGTSTPTLDAYFNPCGKSRPMLPEELTILQTAALSIKSTGDCVNLLNNAYNDYTFTKNAVNNYGSQFDASILAFNPPWFDGTPFTAAYAEAYVIMSQKTWHPQDSPPDYNDQPKFRILINAGFGPYHIANYPPYAPYYGDGPSWNAYKADLPSIFLQAEAVRTYNMNQTQAQAKVAACKA